MLKALNKFLGRAALAALVGSATGLAQAGEQADKPLTPYTAQYKTTTHGMSLSLNRKLERSADGSYTLTNGGKIMVMGFNEVSVFHLDGTAVIPKSYVYQGSGLINRRREVHFTPGSDSIRSLYKGQWYELPYTDGTLDRMSQQEQLRLLLLNDPTPKEDINFRVADGKRIKDYLLSYRGETVIETPMGKFNTLHFERMHDDDERKSDTWVAPELDYLIVKAVHVENGKSTELILTGAKLARE